MQSQLAPRFPFGWRKRAAVPSATQADGDIAPSPPPDDQQMRRATPILAVWLAFYAIAVVSCLSMDRQQAAEHATSTTAAAETVGAR